MGRVEVRVEETVAGVQSTVHRAMEGFKQMLEAVDGAKTAVDEMLEPVKGVLMGARAPPLGECPLQRVKRDTVTG